MWSFARAKERWSRLDHVQRFSIVALVCALGCALTFGWLLKSTIERIVQVREDDLTSQFVAHQVHEHLSLDIFSGPETFESGDLGERIKSALHIENIFRVKIYDSRGYIIWSDEVALIGMRFPDNRFLGEALAGRVASVVESPSRTEHIFERDSFSRIMETYVPIREGDAVIGVVEIYRHPVRFFQQLRRASWLVWSACLGGGALLYLAMVSVVRRVNDFQRGLERNLRRSAKELAAEKRRLEGIVNAMGAGLVLVDLQGRAQWANRKAQSWLDEWESIGLPVAQSLCSLKEPCGQCPFEPDNQPNFPVYCELKLTDPSSCGRVFQLITTPETTPEADQAPTRFLQLILDVTKVKEVESQLQQAAKMSQIGQLAGGIAHQINNPVGIMLTTITHHLTDANRDGWTDGLREDFEMMKRQCQRVDHAVQSLLSFSRTSENLQVPVDVREIVDEAVLLTRPRMSQNAIELRTRLEEGLPPSLGDPNELLQVVLNLVNNAIDAMPDGGALEIELRASAPVAGVAADGNQGSLLLTVSDTGLGLRGGQTDRVFEPFFTTKEIGSGTGLGLTVAKRIVDSLGGRIWAENGEKQGAVFRIALKSEPANGI